MRNMATIAIINLKGGLLHGRQPGGRCTRRKLDEASCAGM